MVVYWIAGGCAAGLTAIWFVTVYRELDRRRRTLKSLKEQLRMHRTVSARVSNGPDREVAARMLETNRAVYREAVRSYNQLLKKPLNCLPAFLMGFHPVDEQGHTGQKNR